MTWMNIVEHANTTSDKIEVVEALNEFLMREKHSGHASRLCLAHHNGAGVHRMVTLNGIRSRCLAS